MRRGGMRWRDRISFSVWIYRVGALVDGVSYSFLKNMAVAFWISASAMSRDRFNNFVCFWHLRFHHSTCAISYKGTHKQNAQSLSE